MTSRSSRYPHLPDEQRLAELKADQQELEAVVEELREIEAEIVELVEKLTVPERRAEPECGTERAYLRHRHRGEQAEPCMQPGGVCREAHNLHNRVKYREKRARAREKEALG